MELTSESTVLLTGANGGIGQAIARAFHAAGAKLVLTARRADALRGLVDELGARVIIADLADRPTAARVCAEAGDVDVLVANAALPASGLLGDFSVEEIDRALDVNLRAPLVMAKATTGFGPCGTAATRVTEPMPVETQQPIRAALAAGVSGGTVIAADAGTTVRSRKVPIPRYGKISRPPASWSRVDPSGMRCSSARVRLHSHGCPRWQATHR